MSVFKHALAARDAHIRTLAYCPGRVIPAGNRHGIRLIQRSPPDYGLLTARFTYRQTATMVGGASRYGVRLRIYREQINRYAAQRLYAPLRAVGLLPGIQPEGMRLAKTLTTLLPALPVNTMPVGGWRLDTYITWRRSGFRIKTPAQRVNTQ